MVFQETWEDLEATYAKLEVLNDELRNKNVEVTELRLTDTALLGMLLLPDFRNETEDEDHRSIQRGDKSYVPDPEADAVGTPAPDAGLNEHIPNPSDTSQEIEALRLGVVRLQAQLNEQSGCLKASGNRSVR